MGHLFTNFEIHRPCGFGGAADANFSTTSYGGVLGHHTEHTRLEQPCTKCQSYEVTMGTDAMPTERAIMLSTPKATISYQAHNMHRDKMIMVIKYV